MTVKICYEDDCVEIENARELWIAFHLTPPEADFEILAQLGNKINDLVTTDNDFLLLLPKVIGSHGQSKIPFLKAFGDNLSKVIKKGTTLSRTLAFLANEPDQEFLLNTLGENGLKSCISKVEDIAECLEWLYGKMDKLFLDIISWEYVFKYIHNGEDLGVILRYLNGDEEKEFLDRLGWDKVIEIIQTPNDLAYVLTGLDPENEGTLVEKMDKDKIRAVIPFKDRLEDICRTQLGKEDAKILREKYA